MLERLNRVIGDRYAVSREIGAGGMATVWLAEDLRHGRPVAIKVLRPDVAEALGTERFLREIEIAARLDHPHILPVYDSGDADGLLYYVMPYVKGETLRERLDREKHLAVDDALRIARDIGDALAYAHERGVVHRDIKPENVLLAGGHARVADFGIARAVTAAGGGRLTGTNVAIGTPAYMSPEQATGSAEVDGRSDVYALGCVLYEMLAGVPPFTAPTLERVLHQHIVAEPASLDGLRPAVGADLAAVVRRALAKIPADRYSPTQRFVDALDRIGRTAEPTMTVSRTASSQRVPGPVGRLAAVGLFVVLLVAAITALRGTGGDAAADSLLATGAIAERERMLLADFENHTQDSTVAATVTELLRVGLTQTPVVNLLDPVQVAEILLLMARDPGGGFGPAVALEAAQREGIGLVLAGEVRPVGGSLVTSARIMGPDGQVMVAVSERADGEAQLLSAVDRLSAELRRRIGESLREIRRSPRLDRVTTASLPALRLYAQSHHAWTQGDIDRAIRLAEEAIRTDTAFAMAYRRLSVLLSNDASRRADAVNAAIRAYDFRDRLTHRERHLVTANYHMVVAGNRDLAIAAYRSVLDAYPDDYTALNNLGVIYSQLRDHERAAHYYEQALRADSTIRLHYSNLANTLALREMHDSAAVIVERFAGRFPGNPEVTISRIAQAAMRKDYDHARELGDSLIRAQRGTAYWEAMGQEWYGSLFALHGRMRDARASWRRSLMLTSDRGVPDLYLERIARTAVTEAFIAGPDAGRELLDSTLARISLAQLAPMDRRYPQVALAYAVIGATDRAKGLLAEYDRLEDADHSRDAERWAAGARGVIALVEGRTDQALTHLREFDDGNPCETCAYAWLARAHDAAGSADSALAYYAKLVATPSAQLWYDAAHMVQGYTRLGELYEARGDLAQAAAHYQRALALWENADPELEWQVDRLRERLARLGGEPRPGGR